MEQHELQHEQRIGALFVREHSTEPEMQYTFCMYLSIALLLVNCNDHPPHRRLLDTIV